MVVFGLGGVDCVGLGELAGVDEKRVPRAVLYIWLHLDVCVCVCVCLCVCNKLI